MSFGSPVYRVATHHLARKEPCHKAPFRFGADAKNNQSPLRVDSSHRTHRITRRFAKRILFRFDMDCNELIVLLWLQNRFQLIVIESEAAIGKRLLLAVPLLPALLDQFCDQTRPAGLVAGTEAGTIVPVEVFEVG